MLVELFALVGCYTALIRSCGSYRCPILEGPLVFDCLTLEVGTYRLYRNSVFNPYPTNVENRVSS